MSIAEQFPNPRISMAKDVSGILTGQLLTFNEWSKLGPKSQGYVLYMQAEKNGSELKGVRNPYNKYTDLVKFNLFERGQALAVLEAQDSEE